MRSVRTAHPAGPVCSLVLLLAAVLSTAAAAHAQVDEGARCGWCATTGRMPFEVNKKLAVESERGETWKVQFCSEAIDSDNHGLSWQACTRCKRPDLAEQAQAEYDAIVQQQQEWLQEKRLVDETAKVEKKPLVHVETTHFWIATDVPKLTTADKKSYRTHELAHLYAQRFEALYARFQSMFGVEDRQNIKNKHALLLFQREAQAFRVAPAYTGLSIVNANTVKRSGGVSHESVIVSWWNKGETPKDDDMWRHQTHNMVHQLTAILYDLRWFKPGEIGLSPPWLNDKYGWLDEGLAHWFEIDFDEEARTYCFREQNTRDRWGSDDWRKNIYKAVLAEDIPAFSDVITKPTQSLSAKEHQFAWSWVDFLMARDSAAMGTAFRLCKQEAPVRDILKEAWGLSMLGFEEQWAAWVAETYAPTRR